MAGNMHMPTSAPACRLDPRQHNPRTLPIRQDWAFDGGASCGGATTAADRHRLVIHDPACLGCARYLRAVRVEDGRIIPHPQRIGRAARQRVAECSLGGGELPAEPGQLEATQRATSERREGEVA